MSFKKDTVDPPSSLDNMVEKVISVIGPLEDWESEELKKSSGDFGRTCYDISNMKQSSIPRTMKWLKMSAEDGWEQGILVYGGLLYGLNRDLQYKGDEAAWWVKRVKDKDMVKKVGSFDSDASRARRHLTRLFLSGSLSKNQDSVLYRSFFRSSLREVHLLPLISKYLVGEEKREEKREERENSVKDVKSLVDISLFVFSSSSSFTSMVTIYMRDYNQFLCFLPLLFSLSPNLKRLSLDRGRLPFSHSVFPHIDLSLLQQVNTSKLEKLNISRCSFDSLSPLSLCDLSSLRSLTISQFPKGDGFHPLNGLSSEITRSLKKLTVFDSNLKDISPLSDCDLSSLESLNLHWNGSLSSLSPLRGSDLSSLKYLNLSDTNISDLSPLCECKGLALEELDLHETPIEDLSPLSLLDLSRLKKPIDLQRTKVSDLSPLENISYDGVEVNISDTPAMKKMVEEGLESPQTIGKVKVMWY